MLTEGIRSSVVHWFAPTETRVDEAPTQENLKTRSTPACGVQGAGARNSVVSL